MLKMFVFLTSKDHHWIRRCYLYLLFFFYIASSPLPFPVGWVSPEESSRGLPEETEKEEEKESSRGLGGGFAERGGGRAGSVFRKRGGLGWRTRRVTRRKCRPTHHGVYLCQDTAEWRDCQAKPDLHHRGRQDNCFTLHTQNAFHLWFVMHKKDWKKGKLFNLVKVNQTLICCSAVHNNFNLQLICDY